MSQYEARLEKDLAHIREKLAALATAVQTGLADAGGGLLAGAATRAYAVVLGAVSYTHLTQPPLYAV